MKELDLVKQKFYCKLRETNDEIERIREERNEYKYKLESKERDQLKSESKIKALEKIINTNGNANSNNNIISSAMRTPMHSSSSRPPLVPNTPINHGSGGTSSNFNSGGSSGIHSATTNLSSNQPLLPSSSNPNLAFNSGGSSTSVASSTGETPLATPYRSSRITHLTNTIMKNTMQTPSAAAHRQPPQVGSIINSAVYNKYQTPAKPPQPVPLITRQHHEGMPVANKRAGRRSKSAEMWLDHRPPTTAKIDTVLQPKMQRKKSVSKVELTDAKKSTKYVLTHQSQDEHGEIRTNLIKVLYLYIIFFILHIFFQLRFYVFFLFKG